MNRIIRGTVTPTAMAVSELPLSSSTGSGNYIRFLLQSKFESIKHNLNNKKKRLRNLKEF